MHTNPLASPLHTLKLLLTALGILFLSVSVFAYAWGGQSPWSLQAPLDDDARELLGALRREGLDCRPRAGRPELVDCVYRQPTPGEGRASYLPSLHGRLS